jgi:hypothetical protein
MFLWYPVLDLARAPRRTARKKGSGYENVLNYSLSPTKALTAWPKLNLQTNYIYTG